MRTLGPRKLVLLSSVAALIAVVFLTLGAFQASAAAIGGFAVRPAQFDPNNPATRAYFIVNTAPGGQQKEAVVITNHASEQLTLEVDAVDGLTGVTSGAVYANRGVAVHAAGGWVTPAVRSVTVPAHTASEVGFTVRVPRSAVAGDHLAGLALQVAKEAKSGGGLSVTIITRVVVGIELVVSGPASPRIQLFSLALAPLPGTSVPSAVVGLEDVGRILCHPQLAVAIKGANATRQATQTLGTILPADRIPFPFRWPGALGYGSYAVSVTASDCGPPVTLRELAAYTRSSGSHSSQASAAALGATAPLPARASHNTPWLLYVIIGLAALLAALLLFVLARRRSRAKQPPVGKIRLSPL